jgi:hypothetical protein
MCSQGSSSSSSSFAEKQSFSDRPMKLCTAIEHTDVHICGTMINMLQ